MSSSMERLRHLSPLQVVRNRNDWKLFQLSYRRLGPYNIVVAPVILWFDVCRPYYGLMCVDHTVV
jgi:hypothetical protein